MGVGHLGVVVPGARIPLGDVELGRQGVLVVGGVDPAELEAAGNSPGGAGILFDLGKGVGLVEDDLALAGNHLCENRV